MNPEKVQDSVKHLEHLAAMRRETAARLRRGNAAIRKRLKATDQGQGTLPATQVPTITFLPEKPDED